MMNNEKTITMNARPKAAAGNSNAASDSNYREKIHKYGISTSLILIAMFILVPLSIQLIFHIDVEAGKTLRAFAAAILVFAPTAVVEFFSYAPILGAGGQYLAFTTGNIMNMKMPAATSALKITGIKPGTNEADPIIMIAIGVSSITTVLILCIGLVLSAQLLPLLSSETLKPAFDNIMPAIMGAVATPVLIKSWKIATVPCILAAIVTIALGYSFVSANQSYLLPGFLVISVGWAYILYRKNGKKA
ncbi:MAG: hypothetical protein LBQ71_04405 [Hungatella sp.]|jgi:hypothetical protein|nr:hypothetical protein [Hungatella sp.]